VLAWPEPHQELTGALPERYPPIDIDRSPWDVFCDPFGLGTDDSWGIEMPQIARPRAVSPSQAEAGMVKRREMGKSGYFRSACQLKSLP
jgi:hypothetical protein